MVQALLVSRELIRVAILWHEMWYEALEEASRKFITDQNPGGMIAGLEVLHVILDAVSRLSSCYCAYTKSQDRVRPRPAKTLSFKRTGNSCVKQEKLVDNGAYMELSVSLIRVGISIAPLVGSISSDCRISQVLYRYTTILGRNCKI